MIPEPSGLDNYRDIIGSGSSWIWMALCLIVLSFGSFAGQGYAWSSGGKFLVRSFVLGAPSPT